MEVPMAKKRKSVFYCGHCERNVSKTTYYRHKADFYNEFSDTWCSYKSTQHDISIERG